MPDNAINGPEVDRTVAPLHSDPGHQAAFSFLPPALVLTLSCINLVFCIFVLFSTTHYCLSQLLVDSHLTGQQHFSSHWQDLDHWIWGFSLVFFFGFQIKLWFYTFLKNISKFCILHFSFNEKKIYIYIVSLVLAVLKSSQLGNSSLPQTLSSVTIQLANSESEDQDYQL